MIHYFYLNGLHSFLIADYDKELDSFLCVNAQFFTKKSVKEWIPLEIIYNCKTKKSYSESPSYRNTKQYSNAINSYNINLLKSFTVLKINT